MQTQPNIKNLAITTDQLTTDLCYIIISTYTARNSTRSLLHFTPYFQGIEAFLSFL